MRGKFSMKKDWVYKMPAHFLGAPFYPYRAIYPDMLAIEVSYETDAERLLQYLPDVFELRTPVVSIQYSNCRDVEWMSGG
ncbi:MAG TPA: acetoacetate decarboxylase, partial [Thermotogota bacterium]|nr:acetoacetate decarboxylase [Thermotogota bacterium]